jgi:hypothetical protein
MKLFIISLVLCLLSGCATSEVNPDKAKPVPKDRLFIINDSSADTKITIIRDSGILYSACNINVFINGKIAATLEASEKATFSLDAGDLYLGAQFSGNGLCINSSLRQLETSIKKGQHKTYRVYSEPSGSMQILPSATYKN